MIETNLCLGMLSQLKRSIPDLRLHKTHQPLIGKLDVLCSQEKKSTKWPPDHIQTHLKLNVVHIKFLNTHTLRVCIELHK